MIHELSEEFVEWCRKYALRKEGENISLFDMQCAFYAGCQAGINAEKVRRGEQIPDKDGKVNHSVY